MKPDDQDYLFVVNSAGRGSLSPAQLDQIRPIQCGDFDLHYASKGHGALVIDGERVPMHQGDLVLVFPDETFLVDTDAAVFERIYIHFDAVGLGDGLGPPSPKGLFLFRITHTTTNSRTFGLCLRIVREVHTRAPGSLALASAYLTELLTRLIHADKDRQAIQSANVKRNLWRLVQARQFMEGQVMERLSLAQMADVAGLSKNYFSRLFRQYTGHTPYEYFTRCKIERAKEMLIENELSVAEIAYSLGFEDAHYFSKAFKRWTDCTPTEYQDELQAPEGRGQR